jgi:hypothetical protein
VVEPQPNNLEKKKNKLDAFVTKVPMAKRQDSGDNYFEVNKQTSYVSQNDQEPLNTVVH